MNQPSNFAIASFIPLQEDPNAFRADGTSTAWLDLKPSISQEKQASTS
jgi:hypothetical protein